ncbi:helix-turn-helix domain-containing protein [Enterovibrio nigricans]|uniref:Homeodomain-like domain-containing protein n=1 Tax=Enterovibrio nigricans DSM 22720 TaxID=1121868 RepID=A0A1T4UE04_9GAMM|nr:helix-turn-helix domain-containing protein [Enterovibrio nigricans]SKA50904.1 Homeodomain-like domain-containing protein [Enterovibrio nigricans DSM 22720]
MTYRNYSPDELYRTESKRSRNERIIRHLKAGYTVSTVAVHNQLSRQTIYNIINRTYKDAKERAEFMDSLEKY